MTQDQKEAITATFEMPGIFGQVLASQEAICDPQILFWLESKAGQITSP